MYSSQTSLEAAFFLYAKRVETLHAMVMGKKLEADEAYKHLNIERKALKKAYKKHKRTTYDRQ
jgi:hypothetical protein|tara:strand:+ start:1099 stop:1287 length:189 start_codon:yes stop_codon:yes gene_type:complete